MIPNKPAALEQATRLLSPGGSIGIADFFNHNDAQSYKVGHAFGCSSMLIAAVVAGWLVAVIVNGGSCPQGQPLRKMLSHAYDFGCKMWFRQDGVYLLEDKVCRLHLLKMPCCVLACWRACMFVWIGFIAAVSLLIPKMT